MPDRSITATTRFFSHNLHMRAITATTAAYPAGHLPSSTAGIALYLARGLSEGPPARMTACTLRLMSSVVILSILRSVGDLLNFGRCGPGLLSTLKVRVCGSAQKYMLFAGSQKICQ